MSPTLKNLFLSGKSMKNTIIGLILGLIIAMWAFYIYTQKPAPKNILAPPSPTSVSVTASPTTPQISDKDQIKIALAKKYNLPVTQVSVIFKEINSSLAAGTVSFSGEGGWFLTAKENNLWKIVADGNGTVSCELVTPYKFPVSMVPECVDKNGTLLKL